jgi:protocatechuate 3,4-dioxygenase beta subunit
MSPLALVGWILLFGAGSAQAAPSPAAPPQTPSTPAASPQAAPSRAPVKPTVPSALEGTVKGPDGKPVDQALVLARPEAARPGEGTLNTRTDAAGHFRLVLRRSELLSVRVQARGLAPRTLTRVSAATPLVVTLEKGAVIEGSVTDPGGAAIAGARIEVRDMGAAGFGSAAYELGAGVEATSDPKGRFRLEGLAAGRHLVHARARGFGSATKETLAGQRCDLVLATGGSVVGIVTDQARKPVAGAMVVARRVADQPSGGSSEKTDASGGYEIGGLEAGTYRLLARHPEFAVRTVSDVVVERTGETRVDVVLAKGTVVIGRLLDDTGRPVPGRVVLQEQDGERSFAAPPAEVGADGRFELRAVPAGSLALAAMGRGFPPKRVELVVAPDEARVDAGDIVLESGLAIRGLVRNASGNGIAEAQVHAYSRQPSGGSINLDTRSEADGSFALRGLTAGNYELIVDARGYGGVREEAEAGTENLVLVLKNGGSVVGLVVDEAGAPIEGFQSSLRPSARGVFLPPRPFAPAQPGGRLEIQDVAEGTYNLEVWATDRESAVVPDVKVTAGAATDVGRVRLGRGGLVRGTVTDVSGAAVMGARVSVRSPGQMGGRSEAETQAGGRFELRGVPAGTVDVVARHRSYVDGGVQGLEVDPARGPTEARIVLRQGGRVEGSARRRDGSGMAGAEVRAYPATREAFGGGAFATVRPDGSFVMEHVPTGRVRLELMLPVEAGRRVGSQTREVEVREGETTVADFSSRDILLSGRVTRDGVPVAGIRIRVTSERSGFSSSGYSGSQLAPAPVPGPLLMEAMSRDDGGYELLVDQPGRKTVSLSSGDGRVNYPGRTVEIRDGEAMTLDLELPVSSLLGVVVDAQTEKPIRDARLTAMPRRPPPAVRAGATVPLIGSTPVPPPQPASATSRPDGHFQLEVGPGDYRLSVYAEGYRNETVEVSAGGAEIRVALTRGLVLTGRVVDERGRGVADARVEASQKEGGNRDAAFTGPDGRFRFDRLTTGRYDVFATGANRRSFAFQAEVAPGDKDVLLGLRPGGHLRLRVLGPDGAPVTEAMAHVTSVAGLRPAGLPFSSPGQTPGLLEIDVPAGSAVVEVRKARLVGQIEITMTEGGSMDTEVRLKEVAATPRLPTAPVIR